MKTYDLLPNLTNMLDEVLGSEIMDKRNFVFQPKANISENENSFHISLLIPGFDKKNISVSTEQNKLIIKGEIEASKTSFKQKEFNLYNFTRSFSLPEHIDLKSIEAYYNNGILDVTIPKKEEFTKKIEVKVK